MKKVVIDGKTYRFRRGVLVEIPEEWVGKIPTKATMNKRDARQNDGRRTSKRRKR